MDIDSKAELESVVSQCPSLGDENLFQWSANSGSLQLMSMASVGYPEIPQLRNKAEALSSDNQEEEEAYEALYRCTKPSGNS